MPKKSRGVWGAARPPVYQKMQIYRCSHKHNYIYNYILAFPPDHEPIMSSKSLHLCFLFYILWKHEAPKYGKQSKRAPLNISELVFTSGYYLKKEECENHLPPTKSHRMHYDFYILATHKGAKISGYICICTLFAPSTPDPLCFL